jgi:glucose-6-phosphate dehydrogenase assembly protein OpcA
MEAPVNSKPRQAMIGEKITLEKIESAFRRFWRDVVDKDGSEAVLKSSTMNLIIYAQDRAQYHRVLEQIDDVISHHPGRIIIVFVDMESGSEAIDARISACLQEPQEGQKQITAEVIVLETGSCGFEHLAGAILPLLLPDLPVYLWCTFSCVLVNPYFKPLLRYTDRLIIRTEEEYDSPRQFADTLGTILALRRECSISDLNWSRLTRWREAIAQFFDNDKHLPFLHSLHEVEIVYSGGRLSSHALLIAGWLSSTLKEAIPAAPSLDDSIFYGRRTENLAIKIRNKNIKTISGLYKVKLVAEENKKSVILAVTAMPDGSLQATVQVGGALYPPNKIRAATLNDAQLLCNELDFMQQDEVYLKTCQNVAEYLNES